MNVVVCIIWSDIIYRPAFLIKDCEEKSAFGYVK